MAKATAKTTALAKWDAQLKKLAEQSKKLQAGVGGGGNFLSIRGGVLAYQGASIPENKMNCIIVDTILENQWYDVPYDPGNPSSPACYAFGREAEEMVPHEQSENIQNADCPTCPQMQFGSADRGKGKACKACQRVALVTASDMDNIEDAQVAYLKLPFFSTLELASYTRQLDDVYHYPPIAFVTELSVVPDPKSQFRVKFKMVEQIESGEVMGALMALQEKVTREIAFPYPKMDAAAAPEPAGRSRSNGRVAAALPRTAKKPVAAPPAAAAVAAVAKTAGAPKLGLKRPVKQPKY